MNSVLAHRNTRFYWLIVPCAISLMAQTRHTQTACGNSNSKTKNVSSCLPIGAKITEIPISIDAKGRIKSRRRGVVLSDLDRDGEKEAVIAYCVPPISYSRKYEACYFRRAHVRVLKRIRGVWHEVWDSGGWGSDFMPRFPKKVIEGNNKREYLRNLFSVRDINQDGKPDIVFTRGSMLSEGDLFEAWTWNGTCFQQIASVGGIVRISGAKILLEFGEKGDSLRSPIVYLWNGRSFGR